MMQPGELWALRGITGWYLYDSPGVFGDRVPFHLVETSKDEDVPFIVLDKVDDGPNRRTWSDMYRFWIKILLEDKTGWVLLRNDILDHTLCSSPEEHDENEKYIHRLDFEFTNLTTNKSIGIVI